MAALTARGPGPGRAAEDRLDKMVGFYRDGHGLPETGTFHGHAGYAGWSWDFPFTAVPADVS